MKKHTWTLLETTTVLDKLVSRYKTEDFNTLIKDIANELNVKVSSIKLGISNMIYILSDGQQGLRNYNSNQVIAIDTVISKHNISKSFLLNRVFS